MRKSLLLALWLLSLPAAAAFNTPATVSVGSPLSGAVNGCLLYDNSGVIGCQLNLPVSNLNSGSGASSSTFWRGDGTWAVPAGAITWPTTGNLVVSNSTNTPSGIAPVNGDCITGVAGAWVAGSCSGGGGGVSVVNGYISGFGLSNDSVAPNSVLDIAAGYAANSANTAMITGTAFTKTTAGAWAPGSAQNGMGTGLTVQASTWYHVFAIINASAADVYFDTSAVAANAPAGTTSHRYIGSFLTDGSTNILAFTQTGQKFKWATNFTDLNSTVQQLTPVLQALAHVPTGFIMYPLIGLSISGSPSGVATDNVSVYPGSWTSGTSNYEANVSEFNANQGVFNFFQVTTNTSAQVFYRLSFSTGNTIFITTIGYINPHVAPVF